MKTTIRWDQNDRQKLFTEAKRIVDTGWQGSRVELWSQAQAVLPPEKRHEKLYSSLTTKLTVQFKTWQNSGGLFKQKPAGKRHYARHVPQSAPTPPAPYVLAKFCPMCAVEFSTIKFGVIP